MDKLIDILIQHEGLKLKPYVDTVGKLTIGVGRNLADNGISKDEALSMLQNDLAMARSEIMNFPWYPSDEVRQGALVELVFNMGLTKFLKFNKTIGHLINKDYVNAAKELLDSKWATQVGPNRAKNIAARLTTGEY